MDSARRTYVAVAASSNRGGLIDGLRKASCGLSVGSLLRALGRVLGVLAMQPERFWRGSWGWWATGEVSPHDLCTNHQDIQRHPLRVPR